MQRRRILNPTDNDKYDLVFSVSLLRHISAHHRAFWNLCQTIAYNGILAVTFDYDTEGGAHNYGRILSKYDIEAIFRIAHDAGLTPLSEKDVIGDFCWKDDINPQGFDAKGKLFTQGIIAFRRSCNLSKGHFANKSSFFETVGLTSKTYRRKIKFAKKEDDSHVEFEEAMTPEELTAMVRTFSTQSATMIYGPFGLGDALMITPSLKVLKKRLPRNPIHIFCCQREYDMFLNNPNIDLLVTFPLNWEWKYILQFYSRQIAVTNIINGNPKAEIQNAYELMAETMNCQPMTYQPEFYPSKSETIEAYRVLTEAGINLSKDKIVIVHPHSTSMLRAFPENTLKELLEQLITKGWLPIVFWPEQNEQTTAIDQLGLWTSTHFRNVNLRILFAMIQYAEVVIATDSVVSHLAEAFNKPSVLLYGPIAAELRAKYFRKALPLQADVPCSPCFQHRVTCMIDSYGVPACMKSFSVNSILVAMEKVIKPGYQQKSISTAKVVSSFSERNCQFCGCNSFLHYFRKADIIYRKCVRCGSVHTNKVVKSDTLFSCSKHHYLDLMSASKKTFVQYLPKEMALTFMHLASANRKNAYLLDFGSGSGQSSAFFHDMGCNVDIFEPDKTWKQYLAITPISYWTCYEDLMKNRKGKYDIIYLMHTIHFLKDAHNVLSNLMQLLAESGCFIISYFDAGRILEPVNSQFLQSSYHKPPRVIPNREGLRIFFKEYGFVEAWVSDLPDQISRFSVFKRAVKSKELCN